MISIDFFTVPTIRCEILFCFLILSHDRRRVLYFNVTPHPTATWTARQIIEAFPWDTGPCYLLRDRDRVYSTEFGQRVAGLGIAEVLTAPHAPWQSPYVERLIGSIRRECLDHVIVRSERHLRCILAKYQAYYRRTRTHLSLAKDAPDPRLIQSPEVGDVVAIAEVGGLHHRYERRAA